MATKLNKIIAALAERLEDLSKGISRESASYLYEASFTNNIYSTSCIHAKRGATSTMLITDYDQSVDKAIVLYFKHDYRG